MKGGVFNECLLIFFRPGVCTDRGKGGSAKCRQLQTGREGGGGGVGGEGGEKPLKISGHPLWMASCSLFPRYRIVLLNPKPDNCMQFF